jgi:hypothetical protein
LRQTKANLEKSMAIQIRAQPLLGWLIVSVANENLVLRAPDIGLFPDFARISNVCIIILNIIIIILLF